MNEPTGPAGLEPQRSTDETRRYITALAASEARYRSILNASPDAIAIADLAGRITMFSARAASMFGSEPAADVVGRNIAEFIAPEDRAAVAGRLAQLFAGTKTGTGEYRGLRLDGATFDIDVNSEFIRDPDGKPTEIVFVVRDITERKQAREAIQQSNDLLRSIIETVPTRIFWKDRNLRYLGCNTPFARDAGLDSPADLIGKTDLDMVWVDQASLYQADDLSVIESGVPKLDFEEPQTTPEGGEIWLSTSKVPLRNERDEVIGILGIYHDVTERKLTGDALRESLTEKDSLLREIHHRVKNNLQVITSLLRLEAGRSPEAAVKLALGEMQGRVLSMSVLHETLYKTRAFGRVDLAGYLRELAHQFFRAHAAAAASARLKLELSPVEVRIEQGIPCGLIVNELMTNSFKYAFPDDRPGEIGILLRSEPDHEILLRVTDTGPGLPEDFELRKARSLGMQLVSDLARQIGGRLEIGPGPGARFDVRFRSATGPQTRPGKQRSST